MGAVFVLLVSSFVSGFLYIAIRNFDSDLEIIGTGTAEVRSISATQRELIDAWVRENGTEIPEGKGYRWLLKTYPSKPWLLQK